MKSQAINAEFANVKPSVVAKTINTERGFI